MKPFAIAKHKTGTFLLFEGGAVRRSTGLPEVVHLEQSGVPVFDLDDQSVANAAAVSKALFGI